MQCLALCQLQSRISGNECWKSVTYSIIAQIYKLPAQTFRDLCCEMCWVLVSVSLRSFKIYFEGKRWILCLFYFIYLFGVLLRFQHCTDHITMGSWKGRGNQYIEFIRVLYCKLLTNDKQLPAFPLEAMPGTEPRPQRWEA